MVWIRCCPRCNGDLRDNQDMYGSLFVCIQCGYYLNDSEETRLRYLANLRPLASTATTVGRIASVMTGAPEEVQK